MDVKVPKLICESPCCRHPKTLLFWIILLSVACFLLKWAILPRLELDLQEPKVRLEAVAVSPCPLDAAALSLNELTTTWNFTIVFINPNKKLGMSFQGYEANLFYGDGEEDRRVGKRKDKLMLGATPLPSLYLNKMSNKTVSFRLATLNAYVGDGVAKKLISSSSGACWGSAILGLKIKGFYTFNASTPLGTGGTTFLIHFCDLFPPTNNRTGQSQPRECNYFSSGYSCLD